MSKCKDHCQEYKKLRLQLEMSLKGSWFVPESFEQKLENYCKGCENK